MYHAPETRRSLILRLQRDDSVQAWEEFVEIYQPVIYRLARAKGLQDADAVDLTQEALARVAQAVQRWNPDPQLGTFRGWLSRITRNLVIQFLRNQRRRPHTCDDTRLYALMQQLPDPNSHEASLFDIERERQLFAQAANRIRHRFNERTWRAFWWTTVENWPVCEVAEQLQMTAGAIYVARSRIMARLRQAVQEMDDADTCRGEFDQGRLS